MEQLTWTGAIGNFLDPIFSTLLIVLIIMAAMSFIRGFGTSDERDEIHWQNYLLPAFFIGVAMVFFSFFGEKNFPSLMAGFLGEGFHAWMLAFLIAMIPGALITWIIFRFFDFDTLILMVRVLFALWLIVGLIYLVLGILLPRDMVGIVGNISRRLIPTWIALIVIFTLSIAFKSRLGFYGRIFDNTIGMIGFGLVMFWVFTAIFGGVFGWIATQDALFQIALIKNDPPGSVVPNEGLYPYYLLGGDHLGRDVFSRVVVGAWVVVRIAPLATLFAFMVGITLGLPAGYYGGRADTALSFLANLILAFPVILLFYLLVTPEIEDGLIPIGMAAVLFIFPIIFLVVLFNSRYFTKPALRNLLVGFVLVIGGWIYLSILSKQGTNYAFLPQPIDRLEPSGGMLIVFVSVVFVNAPTVFRIVRGLTMDIKSRDYVGAAQTRGERSWYIMLWEILPNVRGPLIVDFCLRIGYVIILLGTLGFLGLGLPPDSPDWGSTINSGRKLLSVYPYPALPPAIALMSLVLGLNLLADGLREESMKD